MRIRSMIVVAIAAATLVGGLAGCTSDKTPSIPSGVVRPTTGLQTLAPVNDYCKRLIAANPKITAAQTALSTGGDSNALKTIVTELTGLKKGAPSDIQASLDRLVAGFQAAADAVAHPTAENQAKLSSIAAGMATDGRSLAAYAANKCKAK